MSVELKLARDGPIKTAIPASPKKSDPMSRQESRLLERIDSNNAAQIGVVEARSAAKPERACFSAHMIIPLPVTQKSMPVAIIKGNSLRDGQIWELRK